MRIVMRLKKAPVLVAIALTLAGVAACSSSTHSSNTATNVPCGQVATALVSAQNQLNAANATLSKDKGTPGEADAQKAVTNAINAVNALQAKQDSPACSSSSSSATPTPSPSATNVNATACSTWKVITTTPDNGNWLKDGDALIQAATTPADALKAADHWLQAIKVYPGELNGASLYFLDKSVPVSSLMDKQNCATQAAADLVQEMETYFVFHPPVISQAPVNANNSGTSNGTVVANPTPGINGNRKAIAIVGKDGKIVYIMARCGNVVTVGPPPVPTTPVVPPTPPPGCTLVPPNGYVVTAMCTLFKPPQSWGCMQNNTTGCPPNPQNQPANQPAGNQGSLQGPGNAPSSAPSTPVAGPGAGQGPPPPATSGNNYVPPSSAAPGGASGPTSSPTQSVQPPQPSKTPSPVITSGPVATGTPPPPP